MLANSVSCSAVCVRRPRQPRVGTTIDANYRISSSKGVPFIACGCPWCPPVLSENSTPTIVEYLVRKGTVSHNSPKQRKGSVFLVSVLYVACERRVPHHRTWLSSLSAGLFRGRQEASMALDIRIAGRYRLGRKIGKKHEGPNFCSVNQLVCR